MPRPNQKKGTDTMKLATHYTDTLSLDFCTMVDFGLHFGAVSAPAKELTMNNVRLVEINDAAFVDDIYPAMLLRQAHYDAVM